MGETAPTANIVRENGAPAYDARIMKPRDDVWKSGKLVQQYLTGVRGAIPLAEEQIAVMLRLIGSGRRKVRRFLDLGCGDGLLGAAILDQHPKAKGVFVDFSEPMLDACRNRVKNRNATTLLLDYGNRTWVEAVAAHGRYDAIVSGFSIHHQPDRRKRTLYREIYHLLTPGGWFVNLEHVAPLTPLTTSLFDAAMVEGIHRQQPHLTRTTIRGRYVKRADKAANILAPVEDQCRWLRRIGYEDVDCYLKIFELAVFGGRKP
jgi:tRNA (cmo5U34)-methyltransferase